ETQEDKMGLDMTDFLTLMVTELKNQSIDQTADTSDMLNQLVQMQMVQALVNMTDASVMSYAASLVGKEVTVAQYDADGNLQEVVGVVTGTGTYDGNQVVFVGDKYYLLSEILAVGTLPKPETDPGEGETEGDGSQDGGENGTDAAPEV
uniref:flagellar hook capping FlgD N-terminal domain-containing protein n=2 Tax=Clostridia TaxID=186801 RepID=UPI00307935F0